MLFCMTLDPLVYENVCVITSLPTKRIQRYRSEKHFQEFYPQDGAAKAS